MLWIPNNFCLGMVAKIFYKNCFQTNVNHESAAYPTILIKLFLNRKLKVLAIDFVLETCFPNGIMIYSPTFIWRHYKSLINKFSSIWESQGFVNIPSGRWMIVSLCLNWESKLSGIKPRVYCFGYETHKLVKKTFNKM